MLLDLRRRGIPSAHGSWIDATQITRILTNPGYIGQRVHRGKVVGPASWEPLVDEALWARVQTRLKSAPVGRRPDGYRHLLTSIARCGRPAGDGICGETMTSLKAGRGDYRTLACPTGHLARREDIVDEYVTAVVLTRLAQPDVFAQLDALNADHGDSRMQAALDELEVLRARKREAADAYAEGRIDLTTSTQVGARLDPQVAAADRRAREWAGLPDVVGMVAGTDAEDRWSTLSVVQRRAVVTALIDVVILPVGKGKRVFNPAAIRITWRAGLANAVGE